MMERVAVSTDIGLAVVVVAQVRQEVVAVVQLAQITSVALAALDENSRSLELQLFLLAVVAAAVVTVGQHMPQVLVEVVVVAQVQ
jgi:hypothetical protein